MYKPTIKVFSELTTTELYQILRLRSEVFVVEQDCVYQDIDDKDQQAIHLFISDEKEVIAYTRLFAPGLYFDTASIGRVVVSLKHRKGSLGHQIMDASVKVVQQKFNTSKITISAQTYLKKFYESHGFVKEGNEYLEDGIPHIKMINSN
ncbi:MAG: GNAT family N-acetyltransferase [Urechidicola sp.]|nr:GNAT family N-acetyltransferase [Urechidicola sp.]